MIVRLLVLIALASISDTARADDCESVAVWRDGARDGSVCRGDAAARGLVVIDLRDDWVPPILAAPDGTGPGYQTTYVALAQERFADAGADADLAARDRYLELFGIEPSLGVVRTRLDDDARHRCHAAIDDSALETAPDRIAEEPGRDAIARLAAARALRAELDHDRARRKLADLEALAATDAYYRRALERLSAMDRRIAAIRVVQAHLACDAVFESKPIDGAYTWQTSNAVETFQRGAMILPSGIVDAQTREAFLLDSRERDVRTALRALRERVVAATGLIEDGTAGTGRSTVLGRALEPEATWRVRGHEPLDGAAPDLISPATEAVAKALGWTDAATIRTALDAAASAEPVARVVAVPLPAPPAYHTPAMQLSIEIDRGDVWHDPVPRWRDAKRRPALIVYATTGDHRIPLARWATTIGGWQPQNVDGIDKRWKESPAGPRIWRDLYVGPSWLPPASTPDRELVRKQGDRYVLAREQLGPSYRAAFGMVAFIHLVEERERGVVVETWDQGIRTHGTGNLVSLANGVSHGCHRLLGLHAIRLAGFVLAHHEHIHHGDTPTYYRRVVRHGGRFPIAIDTLGYRIELVPPIPVDVVPGRIHR